MTSRSVFAIAAGILLTASAAFSQTPAPKPEAAKPAAKPAGGKVLAHFVTSEGNITAELFEADAPLTVANFVGLANGTKEWTDPKGGAKVKRPFYDGLTCHRIIAGFMIQCGDPLGNGTGGPGYKFADEFKSGRKIDKAGVLAMANAGPGTNGSQFFVTLAPANYLTGKHTVFGEVVQGLDVVQKIGGVQTTKPGDKPVKPVIIKSVKIERQ
jgi:peptidyl-prolyl cis-trans isomerase A (cyclophilin A)